MKGDIAVKTSEIHIRDPFVLVEDGKYYMYGSRGPEAWGHCTGLDVYVSTDLLDWSEPTEVFTPPADFWSNRNFWAPEVHKYNGSYYMFVSFVSETRRRGTQILKSDSPMGPFRIHSDGPVTPAEWNCLDGTLYVENGKPYIVFCHEWTQVQNGEMCALELCEDLKAAIGAPILLFKASEPSWATGLKMNGKDFVTDGPFFYRTSEDRLILIWSSFSTEGYCEALAYTKNNSLLGEWIHDDRLLFKKDGGHGMLFKDLNGDLRFVCHQPNNSPNERPVFSFIEEREQTLYVKE